MLLTGMGWANRSFENNLSLTFHDHIHQLTGFFTELSAREQCSDDLFEALLLRVYIFNVT